MYDRNCESKDAVSVTDDKKGNKPTRLSLVDMEAALKAEHCWEFDNEMQFWAVAAGMPATSSAHATVLR